MAVHKVHRRILFGFYTISGLYTLSASFIWGINTLFLLDAGLDIYKVFIANAFFTAGMTLFEIPTGVFADTKGRRFSFLLALIVIFLGTIGYLGSSFYQLGLISFCFFSLILGLGFTFYSGAVEAWVVDELQAQGFKDPLDNVFSVSGSLSGITMILGTVAGGFLGQIDLSLPYLARAGSLFLLFILAFSFMKETGFTPKGNADSYLFHFKRIVSDSFTFGWKNRTMRAFIQISFFQSLFMMWGFYASQPYFLNLLHKPDAVWISGLITASAALSQTGGNMLVPTMTKIFRRRTSILLLASSVTVLAAACLGFSKGFLTAFPCFLIMTASFGLFGPVKQGYIHQIIPGDQRATVLSFDSLVGNGGGIIGQPLLGYISRTFSISAAYMAGAFFLTGVLPFLSRVRQLGETSDLTESPGS